MKLKILISLLLLCNIFCRLSIKNKMLVDEQGRELRIHGTNVVVKVPPYIPRIDAYDPEWSFSEEDMVNCTKWGFNGIRLGMMWAGVEPQKDQYNETYLDTMQKLINMAGKHGIYTLIDYHQDIMGQKFCGDGIPTWLADELKLYKNFPFPLGKKIPLNASGLPSWDKCDQAGWGKYYFSYDVGHAFAELYRKDSHLNQKFTAYWKKIASRFKGNPYVLGYELINEPFVGNAIRDLFLVVPSVAERAKFQDFYDRLAHQIRQVDPDTPIFFEPITFDNAIPAGFNHPPGGKRYADKSVFSYHYYHPPALGLGTIGKRVKDGNRLGVLSFLSQFGSSDAEVLQLTQKYKQSWLYWIYKSYGKNWGSSWKYSPQMQPTQILPELSQNFKQYGINSNRTMTYMQRIAGELLDEDFNFKTKHYVAHYIAAPGGKSILYYCSHFNYPNGHELEINPKNLITYKEIMPGYYEITYNGSESKIIQISLTAF